jgi:peroxiredoxin Q/BCP
MVQLRQGYEEFRARSAEIIVVGPELPDSFAYYWTKEAFPFIGIPDPHHGVLKLYGQEVKLFKLGRIPAQVIVDKQGMVRFAHYGHSMADIPGNTELLEILDKINNE